MQADPHGDQSAFAPFDIDIDIDIDIDMHRMDATP
ncbi:hypothetical protein FHT13_000068 [Xanthomonas arboricola]|nr:hypothetical protein [Xanthomonas arboricola]